MKERRTKGTSTSWFGFAFVVVVCFGKVYLDSAHLSRIHVWCVGEQTHAIVGIGEGINEIKDL